jgi:hypothetical protein
MPPLKKVVPLAKKAPAKSAKVVPITGKTKAAPFKVPKHLADCADMLYAKREERLLAQKIVDALAKEEGLLREHIIANLPKSNASGISGKVANAKIETKQIPQVEDRAVLQAYIKKTGRFDLLQNRLSESAVLEMWADNKKVPGVVSFTVIKVSCTKK